MVRYGIIMRSNLNRKYIEALTATAILGEKSTPQFASPYKFIKQ